mmetsp:Transcript_11077/g.12681  ORF Transcript_11077/g.12681 Transcript_11077/m.12681 type:complete len:408 (-) Transcript_11077:52-1275(-)
MSATVAKGKVPTPSSLPYKALSVSLGLVDDAYGLLGYLFLRRRWFRGGIGNMDNFEKLQKDVFESNISVDVDLCVETEIRERAASGTEQESTFDTDIIKTNETSRDEPAAFKFVLSNKKGFENRVFNSPLADYLPPAAHRGHCRLVYPQTTDEQGLKGVVVHLTMTGDQGYSFRQNMLAKPLAKKGYLSIILIVPCYGKRRPDDQDSFYFSTVEDLAVVGVACIVEGAGLCKWAAKQWPGVPICVTGISWGASMCSGAALLYDGPVAVCPCLGDTSPRALSTGILKHQVDMGPTEETANNTHKALESVNMWGLAAERRKRKKQEPLTLVSVSALNDSIVPPSHSAELHECMTTCASKSEQIWRAGGHASCIAMSKYMFVDPIIRSMDLLSEVQAMSGIDPNSTVDVS